MKQTKIKLNIFVFVFIMVIIASVVTYMAYKFKEKEINHLNIINKELIDENKKLRKKVTNLKEEIQAIITKSDVEMGIIEGSLTYGASKLPDDLEICAVSLIDDQKYCTTTHIFTKGLKYIHSVGYQLGVPPGEYYVFFREPAGGLFKLKKDSISYCNCGKGRREEIRSKRSRIVVEVKAGKKIMDITSYDPCPKFKEIQLTLRERIFGSVRAEVDLRKVKVPENVQVCARDIESDDLYCVVAATGKLKGENKSEKTRSRIDLPLGKYAIFVRFYTGADIGGEEIIVVCKSKDDDGDCAKDKLILVTLSKNQNRVSVNLNNTMKKLRLDEENFERIVKKRISVLDDCAMGCSGSSYYIYKDKLSQQGIEWLKVIVAFRFSKKVIVHKLNLPLIFESEACKGKNEKEIVALMKDKEFVKWAGIDVIEGMKDFLEKTKKLSIFKGKSHRDIKEIENSPIFKEYKRSGQYLLNLLKKKFGLKEGYWDSC